MAVGVGWTRVGSSGGSSAEVTVGIYSDAGLTTTTSSVDIGDTVYINAVPSGIVPTSYTFYLPKTDGGYSVVTQSGATYTWTVDFAGSYDVFVTCTTGSVTALSVGETLTSAGNALDFIVTKASGACALFPLFKTFTGNICNIRRSSDNATSDFTYAELLDGTAVTWVGGGNIGYLTLVYDQTGNERNVYQTTGSWQYIIVESGALVTNTSGQPAARPQNGIQSMFMTSTMRGSTTAVVLCTEINGISTGTQAWLFTYAGNPAIGTYSSNPSDTSSPTTNSGSPAYYVNGSNITAQRGPLGTALIGVEARTIIEYADFNNVNWRNTDRQNVMHYANTSSKWSAIILFNLWDDSETSTLETKLALQYG